jgi:hypothetical protein
MDNIFPFLFEDVALWGTAAPRISKYGSVGIVLLSLSVLTWLTVQVYRTIQPFKRIQKTLNTFSPRANYLEKDELNRISAALKREPLFKHQWAEFEETIIEDDYSDPSHPKIYNTRPAEEFFGFDSLVSNRINMAFFNNFAAIIAGIGLLLTFVALFVGLSKLEAVAGGGKIVGIEGLINGLAGKFFTSIVALICATIFTLIEKPLIHNLSIHHQEFLDRLDGAFTRRSVEKILEDVNRNLSNQADVFLRFGTNLSEAIKENLSTSLAPALSNLGDALSAFTTREQRENTDTLQKMISEFTNVLQGQTGDHFDSLIDVIKSTERSVGETIANQERSRLGFETLVTRLETVLSDQQARLGSQTENLQNTMGQTIDQISSASEKQQSELSNLVERLTDQVTQTQTNTLETMNATLDQILQRVGNWAENGALNLVAAVEETRDATARTVDARNMLEDGLQLFKGTLSEAKEELALIQRSSQTLAENQNKMSTTLQSLKEIQSDLGPHISTLLELSRDLHNVQSGQRETLEKFVEVFNQVESGLKNILGQLKEAMQDLVEQCTKHTREQLGSLDENFSKAANRLKGNTEEVSEALDELGERLDRLLRKEN